MAGGKGSRLLSVTQDKLPKPMTEINGKPILQWQLECLGRMGVVDILIVVGHLGGVITNYFGDGKDLGLSISYYYEAQPLGTAGALSELFDRLDNDFFLIFGDIIFDVNLPRMFEFHRHKCAMATLFVHPNNHPYDSDLIITDDQKKVIGILPKNEERKSCYSNCVNAGLYILNTQICKDVPKEQKTDLEKDILQPLINKRSGIYAYSSPEYVKDAGTPERIESVADELRRGIVSARNLSHPQKCVFLDRDGTLNRFKGLITRPDEIELEDTVVEALKKLNQSGWLAIVITNQPVVARGLCTVSDVRQVHNKLQTILGDQGVYLDDILYCPHHPDRGYPEENTAYKIRCNCRKPAIGLIENCVVRYHIDLSSSWMVGDTTVDIQTGINAGTHTALVSTGEKGNDRKYSVCADYLGTTLLDIVNHITKEEQP